MKKEYMFYLATAYNNKENTKKENYPFQRNCYKDSRIMIGKGKCLKCEFNNGIFGKDELDLHVMCGFIK